MLLLNMVIFLLLGNHCFGFLTVGYGIIKANGFAVKYKE